MTNDILEELDIPHPPYRMARPVARLAVAEKQWDDEALRKQEQERRIREEESWKEFGEQPATPEALDASVNVAAEKAISQAPPKIVEIEQVQSEYRNSVSPRRTDLSVGDVVTEGNLRASVLEVNAEGRPTRLETIEEPKPEPISEVPRQTPTGKLGEFGLGMKLTSEQQAALRAAEEKGVEAEKVAKVEKESETVARKDEAPSPDESLDILHEAQEGKGPVPQTLEAKEPQENVLDVLREGQSEPAPILEHAETQDFSTAQSFEQLRELLMTAGEIIGSTGKHYKANELLGDITDIRDVLRREGGNLSAVQEMLRHITAAGGLREKVRNLLEQEAASTSAKPEAIIPPVESAPIAERPTQAEEEPEPSGAEEDLEEIPGIREMGEDHPPRWWDRVGLNVERSQHDLLAWVASVRAKKAEGNLARKEKKVTKLEKKARELANKNWMGALWSPIKYSARISWYRWREGKARAALERHQDSQERHENVRNEVLNIMASQFDTPLKTHEARARAFAKESDENSAGLDNLDAALSALNAKIATERNSNKREILLELRKKIMEKYKQESEVRAEAEAGLQRANAQAIRLQRIKNQILKKATRPRAVVLERKGRNPLATRQKTANAGHRITTLPPHISKPEEEEALRTFEHRAV